MIPAHKILELQNLFKDYTDSSNLELSDLFVSVLYWGKGVCASFYQEGFIDGDTFASTMRRGVESIQKMKSNDKTETTK